MINTFFFGGAAPTGYSTQLAPIICGKEYYTYILKGGPGTGKSQLMKKIAERFAKREQVTAFCCSFDPDSLDAVMLHSSRVVIVDGTPPHLQEPVFPGVCQEIVDLGMYWDKAVLQDKREKILEASERYRSIMTGAASQNKALGLLCDDVYLCAEGLVDRKKIEEAARSFCDRLLNKTDRREGRGKQTIRQLSVMTRSGYMTLQDAAASGRDLYIVKDAWFAASGMFLDAVSAQVRDFGYDTILSPCLLSGRSFSEHLLIEGIGVALLSSNPLTRIECAGAVQIDGSAYYDKDKQQYHEKRLASDLSLIDRIAAVSRENLEDAMCVHDELEQYYIGAMDFAALDVECERLCEEIGRRGQN